MTACQPLGLETVTGQQDPTWKSNTYAHVVFYVCDVKPLPKD